MIRQLPGSRELATCAENEQAGDLWDICCFFIQAPGGRRDKGHCRLRATQALRLEPVSLSSISCSPAGGCPC